MKWLRVTTLGVFCAGIVSVIQGCSEREGALFAVLMLALNFCSGPVSDSQVLSQSMLKLDAGLIAEWKFDEGAGTTAQDTSGNGHVGTLINGATYAAGVSSTALSLDGTNDHVVVPDHDQLDLSAFTIEGWYRYTAVQPAPNGNQGIINKFRTDTPAEPGYEVFIRAGDGFLDSGIKDNGGTTTGAAIATPAATWNHFALTFDGMTTQLFINGQLVQTNVLAVNLTANTLPLLIGALRDLTSTVHRFFGGLIDEMRIYGRVLPSVEVIARCELNNPVGIVCG